MVDVWATIFVFIGHIPFFMARLRTRGVTLLMPTTSLMARSHLQSVAVGKHDSNTESVFFAMGDNTQPYLIIKIMDLPKRKLFKWWAKCGFYGGAARYM